MTPTHFEDATSKKPSKPGTTTTEAGDIQLREFETGARTTFPQETAAETIDIDQRRELTTELAKIRQKVVVEHDLKCARSVEERKGAEQVMAEMDRDSDLGRQ